MITVALLLGLSSPILAKDETAQMTVPNQLAPEIHRQVTELSEQGNALLESGDLTQARERFVAAWALLPEPQSEWEATTWLAAAIGDIDFLQGNYELARPTLQFAMACPGGLGNPFLHLRLGQVQFELGDKDRAADELMRAYMGAGEGIFRDEDPKYRAFLATRAILPERQSPSDEESR